ncbi:MAG TPA: glycosyltransferase family 4 protein [Gemmatimonadaceae bacterium]|nr:glycosyltransferase family 4 protein [Gemmatimonadaceae bacterium]
MRTLFYLSDSAWSGCARFLLAAATELRARGVETTIACCADTRLAAWGAESGIDVVEINGKASTPGGAWDLRPILNERGVEVVLVTTQRDQLLTSSAKLFGGRIPVLRRVPPFGRVDLTRGGKLALRMAAAGLIFTTEKEAKEAHGAGWTIPNAVVPLGVDSASYDEAQPIARAEIDAPPEGVLIACPYERSGRNRIATLFRTLSLVVPRHRDMHAVVFGPGSLDDELRLHAAALGVSSAITFLGDIDAPLPVMRAANVVWAVADGDGGAFACLDAMGLRLPVIAERTVLYQHYVADGITGLLLSPADPATTASNVAAFIANDEKCRSMGNAGRARAQRDFPETSMVTALEQALAAAVSGSSKVTQ